MSYKHLKIIFKSNRVKFRHGVCLFPPYCLSPHWLHSQAAYWHFQDQLSGKALSVVSTKSNCMLLLDGITDSMDVSLSELRELVMGW